eukprot:m.17584 g.17584  ORF g.17584 m.17584 type:complete len:310 (+) comp11324_c0_seq1:47-976(+)
MMSLRIIFVVCCLLFQTNCDTGVSGYFGLSSAFPFDGYFDLQAQLTNPMMTILLDAPYIYKYDNFSLFLPAPPAPHRLPDPKLFARLSTVLKQFSERTVHAHHKLVQLYILNGPAQRDNLTCAYPHAAKFNSDIINDNLTQQEISRVTCMLNETISPFRDLTFQVTGVLEDNLNLTAAHALQQILQKGLTSKIGRNPCGCYPGADLKRLSASNTYWEWHINSEEQIETRLAAHQPHDTFTNDGWLGNITNTQVQQLALAAKNKSLNFQFWYNCIQGYCDPPAPDGQRVMRFHRPIEQLVDDLRGSELNH